MKLGIDASNIRGGGGLTHLVELLRSAEPPLYGFSTVIVWGSSLTLKNIDDRPWLVKSQQHMLEQGLFSRILWQRFILSQFAVREGCNALFVPGSSFVGNFCPVITMSRNMIPFDLATLRRYGWSMVGLRLRVLRWTQARTFRKADGLIFLTKFAQSAVTGAVNKVPTRTTIIPHGVDRRFMRQPKHQQPIANYSATRPFRILYVSIVDLYKHQWHVAEAVAQLRKEGFSVVLDLVGPAYGPALAKLNETIKRIDPDSSFVNYEGAISQNQMHLRYEHADMFLFASSCENMPNILLEGMASGLPIACSDHGAMRDVLQDAGVYFDPEDPNDIAGGIRKLITSPELRRQMSIASFKLSQLYSWETCSAHTFSFLANVAKAKP